MPVLGHSIKQASCRNIARVYSFISPKRRFSKTITYKFNMSRADAEKHIQRNPHPDFKSVEGRRESWDSSQAWNIKQTKNTEWKLGDGTYHYSIAMLNIKSNRTNDLQVQTMAARA